MVSARQLASACLLFCLTYVVAADPVRLIIDTDMGFDVDDVGAVAVANALADLGEVEIIAISHTNAYKLGIGGVSTILNFYGRDDVPLGAYKGPWAASPANQTKYLPDIVGHYPSPVKNSSQVPLAVTNYRKVLVSQPDHSVHIASIGITTNMRDLVLSKPDSISPLSGVDLIAQKVKLAVFMDGMYNFGCAQDYWLNPNTGCFGSAQKAIMNWPPSVKAIFSGVGGDVKHGSWLSGCAANGNPVKQAFVDWLGPNQGRSAWDPITVMIAVRGAAAINCKEVGQGGHNVVDEWGHETWVSGSASNQTRIEYDGDDAQSQISFKLNELLCKPPGPWLSSATDKWNKARGENCYGPRGTSPAHGATDLENPPSSSCGVMTLEACFQKCLDFPDGRCTAVTTQPASNGLVSCYRKADISLEHCDAATSFDTYVRMKWYLAGGFNCYEGHGATTLDPSSLGKMSVRDCQRACESRSDCDGIVFQGADHDGYGDCYRKADINLSACDRGTNFDVYIANQAF